MGQRLAKEMHMIGLDIERPSRPGVLVFQKCHVGPPYPYLKDRGMRRPFPQNSSRRNGWLIHIDLEPEFQAEQSPDDFAVVPLGFIGVSLQQIGNELRIKDTTLLCPW